jgi:hypothetical protein
MVPGTRPAAMRPIRLTDGQTGQTDSPHPRCSSPSAADPDVGDPGWLLLHTSWLTADLAQRAPQGRVDARREGRATSDALNLGDAQPGGRFGAGQIKEEIDGLPRGYPTGRSRDHRDEAPRREQA